MASEDGAAKVGQGDVGAGGGGGMSLPTKLALASALGLGALITGYLVTRQGRRIVRDTARGVTRSPLEYQVLEALDDHPRLGRRRLDVRDEGEGRVALVGTVATEAERRRAVRLASGVAGVAEVRDGLTVGG